ncbi:MAG TPA: glutathione S-transferase [Afifellaceae bacterium]|nr:glutathione S-transferase [Afifellaceae bacterium]
MLTVWGRRSAFNVQKVLWLADELGVDYCHVDAGGAAGGLDDTHFLAMNPHGRIPVIDDDGTVVWESHAILRYLAAQYGAGSFWSDDPATRSLGDRWMDWAQTRLQPDFLVGVFWAFYRTPEADRDMEKVTAKIASCSRHMSLLDTVLAESGFVAGETMTLADIAVGTHLYRYFNIDIERPDVPRLAAYYDRIAGRPAYRKNVMLPFGDLYGRTGY